MTTFSDHLLGWYDRHARALPWRMPPGSPDRADPYHVWLSEVMLQQTTVAAVKPYFDRFVSRWPTVVDLAAASDEDVMAAWAGLGYYSRARNLKACAEIVAGEMGGRFPDTQDALRALPGIGDYTSAAIAAIAFGEAAPVVDGNVERVVTRFTADPTPLPKAKAGCRAFMAGETPKDRPGDFVQAMMDLGATICTPRKPVCSLCPVSSSCEARKQGTQESYPVKAAKKAKPVRVGAAFVATRGEAVWCVRRAGTGLLGGTAGVPSTAWSSQADGATGSSAAPFEAEWKLAGTVRHTFTHFHLELEVWTAEAGPTGDGWWEADIATLPTLFRKAVQAAVPSRSR